MGPTETPPPSIPGLVCLLLSAQVDGGTFQPSAQLCSGPHVAEVPAVQLPTSRPEPRAAGDLTLPSVFLFSEQDLDCYTTVAQLCPFEKPATHCPR
jgi:hypothetical protein